ncbi:tRNA lysidine(34) synthetase TilS [Flavobacteriaceae bacterium F08102]|nr:tRNA lysidine(34) synthetase TilS [Flavobacteriaceae bacterium F08102]
MIDKIATYLRQEFPHLKSQKLLIGASGGLDSTVLAYLMHRLGYSISLAHCNFQLRGAEAAADEAFVEEFAKRYGLHFYKIAFDTKKVAADLKISIQMAARQLRYDWFNELRLKHGFDCILTAHHADDNLETFMINLLRGTGLDGLTGIPTSQGYLRRPLLPFSRKDLEKFARTEGISWREDQSNKETKYLRNKLRLQVIPMLKSIEPTILSKIENTNTHLHDSRAIIDNAIQEVKEKVIHTEGQTSYINLDKLAKYKPIRAYLYEMLKPYGFTAWRDIEKLIESQSGKQIFSKSHVLLKNRDVLCLSPLENSEIKTYKLTVGEPLVTNDFTIEVMESAVCVPSDSKRIALVDAAKISFPLVLRKWQQGDYFYPLGLGGKKKLSKFFKDQKFSLREKESAWLLCDTNKIVWVINQRLDERVAITNQTKSAYKIIVHPH